MRSLPLGRTLRDIVRLAWPVYIAQLAIMANGVIDTVMAGRYGTVDLAGVGIGAAVYATLFITVMGVLFALTPLASRAYGGERHAEIGEVVRQTGWLAVWLAALAAALLAYPDPLLALSGAPPEVEAKTRAYLAAIVWAVPAALFFRLFSGFTTAVSKPRVVMVLNVIGLLLKVPLNWAFMYGKLGLPELGGPGCGAATATTAWITCIAAWLYCFAAPAYRRYRVFARWSWPDWRMQWRLAALGVPIGATFFVDVTAFTFMAIFIARFGPLWSGAHQITANLVALAFMLPLSIGNAASVLAGQALGARDPARARRIVADALVLGAACSLVVAVALYVAAQPIAAFYTSDPAVLVAAVGLLGYASLYHVFDAAQAVASTLLRAYERTAVPMAIYGVALWGLGLGGGYLLAVVGAQGLGLALEPLGARGFWSAAVVGMALTAALIVLYLARVSRDPVPRLDRP